MFKNYLKVALRNLLKEKGYAAINILSLAIGAGVFLFLLLIYQYAVNYDSFLENRHRIYRVIDRIQTSAGNDVTTAQTPWPWAPAIEDNYAAVESSVRILIRGKGISYKESNFNIGVSYVDSTFFSVFGLPLQLGNAETALDGPGQVVITPEISKMLFGNEDPMGKVIQIENRSHEVTGLLKKIPHNSSIYFEILVSSEGIDKSDFNHINDWESHEIYTYLLLRKGTDPQAIESQLPSLISRHIGNDNQGKYEPRLQAYTDMYLSEGLQREHGQVLNPAYLYIFLAIGFLILLISCINFINLATARVSKRNREVGIRKVVGASRPQLIWQYLLEVGIITVLTVLLSVIFVEWALPLFNNLTGEWQVQINYFENGFFWASIAGIIIFVTLVAGAYPAFYLSAFQPSQIFRSKSAGNSRSWLRTGLVVTQFSLAVFLLLCSLIVNKQINFLYQKDLGFDQENLIRMYISENISYDEAQRYRNELLRNPQITNVAMASDGPISDGTMVEYTSAEETELKDMIINTLFVNDQFIPLLDLEIMKGRNFENDRGIDSTSALILNQTAVNYLGWEGDPIGKVLNVQNEAGLVSEATVIGVINDYNYQTLDKELKPLILQYKPAKLSNLLIRVQSPDPDKVNKYIENTWNAAFPGQFFFYYYVSDLISENYTTEAVISSLLSMFTWLTIFVASLGLLGLASYTINQRTKEVGVRKVLGAKTWEIVAMFSKEFCIYIVLALLIGIPVAWLAVNYWLQNFTYHTDVGWESVLIVVVATILVAFLTVSWQSIKAALMNPVDSLRSE